MNTLTKTNVLTEQEVPEDIATLSALLRPMLPRDTNIAVDGPIATGKDTLGETLASNLGLLFVNAGDFYRSIAARFAHFAELDEAQRISQIIQLIASESIHFNLHVHNGAIQYIVNGKDVSDQIPLNQTSTNVSLFSTIEEVQEFVISEIQTFATQHNVVLAGRVMGLKVIPNATFHIELTASIDTRVERRYKQLLEKQEIIHKEQLYNEVLVREENDKKIIASIREKLGPDNPKPIYHHTVETENKTESQVLLEVLTFMYTTLHSNR